MLARPAPSARYRPQLEALEDRTVPHGVPTLPGVGYAIHIHVHLSIFINGQPIPIPANVGISPAGVALPLHTHDASGTLHIESPLARTFVLQEFFNTWGQPFGPERIFDFRADPGRPVTVTVNGVPNAQYGALVLNDGDAIVIRADGSGQPQPVPPSLASLHFVRHLFDDLLHRPPEAPVLEGLAGHLDRGTLSRAGLVFAVAGSAEYQSHQVVELYEKYLHRQPDAGGLGHFVAFLQAGGRVAQVAATLVGSAEYLDGQGVVQDEGFLQALYQDALDRELDDNSWHYYQGLLATGIGHADIALIVFTSAEYQRGRLHGLFHAYLHRAADQGAAGFFAGAFQRGATETDVLAAILASDEYQAHAGGDDADHETR